MAFFSMKSAFPRTIGVVIGGLLIACHMVSPADAKSITPDNWVPSNHAVLKDDQLTADMPEKSEVGDLLSGLKEELKLEPGIYRIRAAVRPKPAMNFGYRLVLTVRSAKPKDVYKRWRPPRSQLTPRPKEIWHAVAEARPVQHNAQGLVELSTELVVTQSHAYQLSVGWRMAEVHLGGRFLKWEQAPTSLKQLSLISLSCDRLEREVHIDSFMADKVVYKPHEMPVLTASISNTSESVRSLRYRVRLQRDLEPPAIAAQGDLTIQARISTPLSVTLAPLQTFGGYRFDLELLDADKLVTTAERSAACSPRYNRIGISGLNHDEYLTTTVNANETSVDHAMRNMREAYISWHEVGFWAPDDFQNLTPEQDRYLSNTMAPHWRTGILNICKTGRALGIGVNAYLKGNYADGRDGFEWALTYPELVFFHRDTGQIMSKYNLDHLLNWDDYTQQVLNRKGRIGLHWHYVLLNTARPSIVDLSAAETVASEKMFGWAGVRFDGDFDVPESETFFEGPIRDINGQVTARPDDHEITYANNVLRYKRKIREKLPEFEFGFNHALDDSHQRWIVGPAIASDESMVMNEPIRSFGSSPQRAYNRWEDYADMLVRYSRIVRSWGGYYQPIGCYGMRADDYLYQSVYTLAAQAKPIGPYYFDTQYTRRLSRFVTRFAGIMCAVQHPIPAADGRVMVTGSAPLQYANYVNFIESDDRTRRYVIQLINRPTPERAVSGDARSLLRPPVTNVKVELHLDPFEKPDKAWLLDPWHEADAAEVPLTIDADQVTAALPRAVSVWSVLIIDCNVEGLR